MRAVLRIPINKQNDQINFNDNIVKQSQNNPLISFSVAPNPLLDYTAAELRQFSDFALLHKYLVHIHFDEDASVRADSLAKYNLTPLELITQAGLLRNKIVLAHAADLTDGGISEISQYPSAGVSFNPISEHNLSTPLTPAPVMLNKNITVAFGTDGEPSSNLDMFAQMRFAVNGYLNCVTGQKFCANSQTIDLEQIIRMATLDGAKILGLDKKIGSLETGKQADLILVNRQPGDDIYSSLVYNTSGEDVVGSIINGKVVMENRRLITINEDDILKKINDIIKQLKVQQ